MITNDSQLKASQQTLERLKITLNSPIKKGIPDVIAEASKRQLKELIEKIEKEIKNYKKIRAADQFQEIIANYDDFVKIPMLYRVVKQMTLDQFARMVEINVRQIARYEKEEYKNIRFAIFLKIMFKLQPEISGKIFFNKKKECFETKLELHSEPHMQPKKEAAEGR